MLSFLKIIHFLKICFLHDELIFFVRIFFCDQVCICTNPRNHLEHLPCSHGDSEPPAVHNISDQFLLGFSGFCEFWADRWSPNPPRKVIKTKSSNTDFFCIFFIGVIDRFQHAELDFGICGSGSAIPTDLIPLCRACCSQIKVSVKEM